MKRQRITIEDRIEKQKDTVYRAKDKYERELEKLDKLISKRNEENRKKIMTAFDKSGRTVEEVLSFLGYDDTSEEQTTRKRRRGRRVKVNLEDDF